MLETASAETPRLQFSFNGRQIRIRCQLDNPSPKAVRVYTKRKKFRLLEELLGCRVQVKLTRARSLQLVA